MGQPKIPQKFKTNALAMAVSRPQFQILKSLEAEKNIQIKNTRKRATELQERGFFSRTFANNTKDLAQNQEGIIDAVKIQEKEFQILSLGVARLANQIQIIMENVENINSDNNEHPTLAEDQIEKFNDAIFEINKIIKAAREQSRTTTDLLNEKINTQSNQIEHLKKELIQISDNQKTTFDSMNLSIRGLEEIVRTLNLDIQSANALISKQAEELQNLKSELKSQADWMHQLMQEHKIENTRVKEDLVQLTMHLNAENERNKKRVHFQIGANLAILTAVLYLFLNT